MCLFCVVMFSQLCTVRGLLQKTTPMLLKLNEKAAAALRERDDYIYERDQAFEERQQVRRLLHLFSLVLARMVMAANHEDDHLN